MWGDPTPLLKKLWGTVERGFTGALKPWQVRRVGQAETDVHAYHTIAIAQAEKYADEIRAGKLELRGNTLVGLPNATDGDALPTGTVEQRFARFTMETQALSNANNLSSVLAIASQQASERTSEPSPDPVDGDWYLRWQRLAQEASNADLREIWARILVSEVEKPSAFSHRTLIVLSQLSREEVLLIQRLAPFIGVGSPGWVFKDASLLAQHGLKYTQLLALEAMGVLQNVTGFGGVQQTYGPGQPPNRLNVISYRDFALLLNWPEGNDEIVRFDIFPVTQAGVELRRLTDVSTNREAVFNLGRLLSKKVSAKWAEISRSGRHLNFEPLPAETPES